MRMLNRERQSARFRLDVQNYQVLIPAVLCHPSAQDFHHRYCHLNTVVNLIR